MGIIKLFRKKMKVPSCVLWSLTKKHSAFIVQPKGHRSRMETFSKDPLNLTSLHNASAQGYTADEAVGVTAERGESEKKKDFRKVYHLLQTKDGGKLNSTSKIRRRLSSLRKSPSLTELSTRRTDQFVISAF